MSERSVLLNRLGRVVLAAFLAVGIAYATPNTVQAQGADLRAANESLFVRLQDVHALPAVQIDQLRALFQRAGYIGQGNPKISVHPTSEDDCRQHLLERGVQYDDPAFASICGARYMAPLYDPETQTMQEATVCIDQFEFPNMPCSYPVVWVRAREAAEICQIMGKRLCDAHEWEGACAGQLLPPDYRFDLVVGKPPEVAIRVMRQAHNNVYLASQTWSYGGVYESGLCATSGYKSPGCDGGGWTRCGSNTFPCGLFPQCRSALGVYDLHGNAAEHMNLPLNESEMASRGSETLGYTEMKGSWFIFDSYRAHEDWCRWRAPFWHGSRVMDPKSHHNYHLGFRCCNDVEPQASDSED
jgi:hypothetical protein